jgi:hypothetical protein
VARIEKEETDRKAKIERDRLQKIEDEKKAQALKEKQELMRQIEEKRVSELNVKIKNAEQ